MPKKLQEIITTFEEYNLQEVMGAPCNRHYKGEPLETGGTSIAGKEAPGVRWLFQKGYIKPEYTVLDYGAGKGGRNAVFLRDNGSNVYAYDPFNGTGADGWEGVSQKLPPNHITFDVIFTSFVVNVVPNHIENDIIKDIGRFHKQKEFHVTRNEDIFDMVKKNLKRGDKTTVDFYLNEFAKDDEELQNAYENNELDDYLIHKFCCFGVQTSRGFQRIPYMEEKGYGLIRANKSFKIYNR